MPRLSTARLASLLPQPQIPSSMSLAWEDPTLTQPYRRSMFPVQSPDHSLGVPTCARIGVQCSIMGVPEFLCRAEKKQKKNKKKKPGCRGDKQIPHHGQVTYSAPGSSAFMTCEKEGKRKTWGPNGLLLHECRATTTQWMWWR